MGDRRRRVLVLTAGGATVLASVMSLPAHAAGRTALSVSFQSGHDGPVSSGSSHWTTTASNDSDAYSMQLDVPQGTSAPTYYSSWASIVYHHIEGLPASSQDPGFDAKSTVSGAAAVRLG